MSKSMYLVLVLATVAMADPIPCSQERKDQVDSCGQKLFMIGDRSKTYLPTNIDQLEEQCTELREAEQNIKNFSTSCLDAMAKQVTGLLVKGASSQIAKICDGDDARRGFLSHTPCFNHKFSDMHGCMESYIDHLQGISKAQKDDKIPLTCCNYYAFKKCINDKLLEAGEDMCKEDDRTYMKNMLEGYAHEVTDLLCGHTPENSDLCNILVTPEKPADMQRTKSILPPFIHTFRQFEH